jgi:hypothetical protein
VTIPCVVRVLNIVFDGIMFVVPFASNPEIPAGAVPDHAYETATPVTEVPS